MEPPRQVAARAIKQNPAAVDMYLLRATMLGGARKAEAFAEADALVKANPDNVEAHVGAAKIYAAYGKRNEAMRASDRALAIGPMRSSTSTGRTFARAKTYRVGVPICKLR